MLKIFRWPGGYAGDTIVSSILSVNPDLISNIGGYTAIKDNGQTIAKTNKEHALFSLAKPNQQHNFLGFTTSANFYKCYPYTSKKLRESDKFYSMLEQKDKNEADHYMMYQIA